MMQSCESSDSCFSRCFINQASAGDPEGVSVWHRITRTVAFCSTTCCESEGESTTEHTSPACSHVSRLHTLLFLILHKHYFHLPPSLQLASQTLPLHPLRLSPNLLHPRCTSKAEETRAEAPGNTPGETPGGCCADMYRNHAFTCSNINSQRLKLHQQMRATLQQGAGREYHLVLNPKNPAFVLFGLLSACVCPNPSIC